MVVPHSPPYMLPILKHLSSAAFTYTQTHHTQKRKKKSLGLAIELGRGHTPDASASWKETTVTQQIINDMSSGGDCGMGTPREHTPGH